MRRAHLAFVHGGARTGLGGVRGLAGLVLAIVGATRPLFRALAALLALALVNSLLLSRWCARWGDLLDAADACVQAEDWAGADAALENLRRDWDARQTWLHIVIEHGEINEAESLLRRCLVLCTAQERTDLRADLAALRSQMVLLNEMERVSVKNIL